MTRTVLRFAPLGFIGLATSGCLLVERFPDVAPTVDASSIDAAPPDPTAIPGLAMWLDASQGVQLSTMGVVSWQDLASGNSPEQLDRGSQPSLRANAINGRPAVHFDGNDQYLMANDHRSVQFGNGDFMVEAVVAYTNVPSRDQNTGYACVFVKSGPYAPYPGPALFGNDPTVPNASFRAQVDAFTFVDSVPTTNNDGSFHYVGMRRLSGVLSIRVDGVTSGSGVTADGDMSAVGMGVYIGGRDPLGHANQSLRGDIAELVAVKGPVSDEQIRSLEAYLKTKYAL